MSGWIRKIIAMITLRGDYRNYRFWRLGNQKLAGSQKRNKKIKTLKIPLIEAGIFRGRFAITENAAFRLTRKRAPIVSIGMCPHGHGPRGHSVNNLMRAYERAPRRSLCCSRHAADVPSSATYLLATDRGLGNPMVSDSTVENNASINGEKYQK